MTNKPDRTDLSSPHPVIPAFKPVREPVSSGDQHCPPCSSTAPQVVVLRLHLHGASESGRAGRDRETTEEEETVASMERHGVSV